MNIVTTHYFLFLIHLYALMVLLSTTDLPGIKIAYHYCINKNNYEIILWDKVVTHLLKAPLL